MTMNLDAIIESTRPWTCFCYHNDEITDLILSFACTNREKFLEIGTYLGASSSAIALAFPNAEVHTMDLPNPETSAWNPLNRNKTGEAHRNLGLTDKIIQHWKSSAEMTNLGLNFDLIFIDGDHSPDAVKRDLDLAFKILNPNGAVVCHDYTDESNGTERPVWTVDIYNVVEEFLINNPTIRRKKLGGWLVELRRD
jgi:precorrin-6B methylase 2